MSGKESSVANESKSYLKHLGLNDNQIRDMHIDYKNPRDQLPPDVVSIRQAEIIPNFDPVMRDLLTPEDYDQQDQTKLVKDANLNYLKQSNFYSDTNQAGTDTYNSDKMGRGERGLRAKQELEFNNPSATGAQTNFLDTEGGLVDGIYNSSTAF